MFKSAASMGPYVEGLSQRFDIAFTNALRDQTLSVSALGPPALYKVLEKEMTEDTVIMNAALRRGLTTSMSIAASQQSQQSRSSRGDSATASRPNSSKVGGHRSRDTPKETFVSRESVRGVCWA